MEVPVLLWVEDFAEFVQVLLGLDEAQTVVVVAVSTVSLIVIGGCG